MWRPSGATDPARAQILLYEPGLSTKNLYGTAHGFSGPMGSLDHPTGSADRSHWPGLLRTVGSTPWVSSEDRDLADEYLAASHEACHQDDRQRGASACGRLLASPWQKLWHRAGGPRAAPNS